MKNHCMKLLSVMLAVCLLLTAVPLASFAGLSLAFDWLFSLRSYAADIVASGSCGENVTWTLDSDGLLTISGEGEMETAPWISFKSSIKTVIIQPGVTSIGEFAFSFCTGLTSVTIPESVTSIGEDAFHGCTGLTSVTIPESVTSIGEDAFYGCTGLTSITIPEGVTSIGEGAFYGCTGLTSITIPEGVTSIEDYTFSGCTGLTSITIPGSVTSIGESAFSGCTGLTSITVANGNTLYYSENNCIIEKESNTLILGCKTSVIPEGVTSIGRYAFYGCTGLTSITIPKSVTSIGWGAFYECTGITDVYYTGTEEQWEDITISPDNESLLNANIHYASSDEHMWNDGEITVPATCGRVGEKKYTCTDCGETKTEIIPATGEHTWELTAETEGERTFTCAVCGETKTEAIPADDVLPGDVDDDGKVTAGDARLALRRAVNSEDFEPDSYAFRAADIVQDGNVTAADARMILRVAVNLDPDGVFYTSDGIYRYDDAASSDYDAKFLLVASVDGTELTVDLYLKDCVGLESADYELTYDPKNLAYMYYEEGSDSEEIRTLHNSFTCDNNGDIPGKVFCGFYFKEALWSSELFAADARPGKTVNINSTYFNAQSYTFEILSYSGTFPCIALQVKETSGVPVSSSFIIGTCEHNTTVDNVTEPATCGKTGKETCTCTVCGLTFDREIPPTGEHTWELTAEAEGERTFTCTVCGKTITGAFSGAEIIATGPCGENVIWLLDSGGLLTIIGEGEMETARWKAFSSSIKTVIIQPGVTSIGWYAFQYCAELTSVTIPESVTSIGSNAFKGCTGLTSIIIPDSVESIDNYAFYECSNLISITGPNNLKELGECVFDETGFYLNHPEGSVYIGGIYYGYKGELPENSKLEIEDGTTHIQSFAFCSQRNLAEIIIPKSVISIGGCAFAGCTGLKKITYKGDGNPLTSVKIADGNRMLINRLNNGNVPNAESRSTPFFELVVKSYTDETAVVGVYANNCVGLKAFDLSLEYDPDVLSTAYVIDGIDAEQNDKERVNRLTWDYSYRFDGIINFAGYWETGLHSSRDAFLDSWSDDPAFIDADSFELFQITFHLKSDKGTSLQLNKSSSPSGISDVDTQGVIIPCRQHNMDDGTITKEPTCFEEGEITYTCNVCRETITEAIHVTREHTWEFTAETEGERTFTCAVCGKTITGAFSGTEIIATGPCGENVIWLLDNGGVLIISGEGEMEINDSSSAWRPFLSSIKAVIIQPGVTSILGSAFYDCTELTSVTIPESVTYIGPNAFSGCTGLTSITIPEGVTDFGNYTFSRCTGLTSITIPESVTGIGICTFWGCTGLASITIPEGVITIFHNAFSDCTGLASVVIPVSVTFIGPCAFEGCTGLTDVYYAGTEEQWKNITNYSENDALLNAEIHYDFDPLHEHIWDAGEITTPATCVDTGEKTYTCTVCGETKTEEIPATGEHTWNAGEITAPVTCVDTGERTYTCTVCGETKTEEIPATGEHTWNAGEITAPVTCVTAGEKTYTCTVCGETKTEVIPATGEHTWNGGEVTKPVTCVAAGEKTYTCTICGETKTEAIPATGEHTWVWVEDTPATCGAAGAKHEECSVCHTKRNLDTEIPATGEHTWNAGEITAPVTCVTAGEKTYTCTVRGETKAEAIPATGEHTWNAGEVTKPATVAEEGEKTYTCTVCGATKTESIPKLTEQPKIDTDTAKETETGVYVKAGETAADLLALAGEGATLTKEDGSAVKTTEKVGSGMVLTKADGTQETVIVKGDNDGDGTVTAADARYALRVAVSLEDPNAWQKDASLVESKDTVTAADARLILRAAVGLEELALV